MSLGVFLERKVLWFLDDLYMGRKVSWYFVFLIFYFICLENKFIMYYVFLVFFLFVNYRGI